MFSDHLRKIDNASAKNLLLIAAGLVIFCLLAAMVMVVDGQVEKAHLREANQASASAATAWCVENSRGVALKNCDPAASSFPQTGAVLGNAAREGKALVTLDQRY